MPTYRECFESAVAAAVDGATVLTDNTRAARAIHSAAEARLRTSGAAWLTPDVLPLGAFIERLYSEAVVSGTLARRVLRREQELHLWRQIIERSASGRELLLADSAAVLASEAFRTACEYEIDLHGAQMNASGDTRAFADWAADFRRQLAEHRWTCPALLSRELAACLSSLRLPQSLCLWIANRTPAQRRFVELLAGARVAVRMIADESAYHESLAECAQRYEFAGSDDELRGAAEWVRQRLQASPDERIGVIFFDLDGRRSQVEAVFRSVLQPERLLGEQRPEVFEIAAAKPLAEYPIVASALALLSLIAAPVGFEAFHAAFRSPYLGAAPESSARFLASVRKHARRQVSFEDFARWVQESSDLRGWRGALARVPQREALASAQPVAYWAKIARETLQAFGWPGSVALNSEEFQCTQSWSELVAEVISLETLGWRCDFRGLVAKLKRAAERRSFKPESLSAPVQIMDVAEAEGSRFDAVWIAGCSDDRWPDSPRLSPLIPLPLLKAAGAPVPATPQDDQRIARVTRRLLQSAAHIALSLALRCDDEREQRWSPLFEAIPAASETVAVPPALAACFTPSALEQIRDSAAPPLHESESAHGGTWLLQDQSNCPFRAFAIRRLQAREAEGPSEALAPTERGKIIEHALQLIWERLQTSEGLAHPRRAAIVADAVERAMQTQLPHTGDPWSARFRALERQRTIVVIEQWLEQESQRIPFEVVDHQIRVEMELAGLRLNGRLDRLDKIGDAHVVIDYKTGAPDGVRSWRVPRPEKPQLPLYAWAMLQKEIDVAGISFASVRRGECAFRGYLREGQVLPCGDATGKFDGIPFDEYTPLWAAELERIASAFVQGDASVDPRIAYGKSKSPCTHCHLLPLCRVQDLVCDAAEEEVEEDHE